LRINNAIGQQIANYDQPQMINIAAIKPGIYYYRIRFEKKKYILDVLLKNN